MNKLNIELTEDLFVWFCIMTRLNKPDDEEYLRKSWQDNYWKYCKVYRVETLQEFIRDFEKDVKDSYKEIGFSNN